MKTVNNVAVDIAYTCGHVETLGGSIADPCNLLAEYRIQRTPNEVCSVCREPKKYPEIANSPGFQKSTKTCRCTSHSWIEMEGIPYSVCAVCMRRKEPETT